MISNNAISFCTPFGENWKKESTIFLWKSDFHPSKWNSKETITFFVDTKLSGSHEKTIIADESLGKTLQNLANI